MSEEVITAEPESNEIIQPESLHDNAEATEQSVDIDDAIDAAFDQHESKEREAAEEALLEEGGDDELGDSAEGADEEGGEVDALENDAPEHWSESQREAYGKIDNPEVRALVREMDKEMKAGYTRKHQKLSDTVRFADNVRDALSPFQDQLQSAGMNEAQAVQMMAQERAQFFSNLANNPKAVIADLAKNHGVEIYINEDSSEEENPELVEVKNELNNLKKTLTTQQTSEINATIEAFANATNEDGSKAYPHYEELRSRMGQLASAGVDSDLSRLYNIALAERDDLFDAEVNRRASEQITEREKKRKADIEKAKKAGRRIESKGIAKPVTRAKSIEDALLMAEKQLAG